VLVPQDLASRGTSGKEEDDEAGTGKSYKRRKMMKKGIGS
jgi:hypothetical protein